jgi:hypothetical protein
MRTNDQRAERAFRALLQPYSFQASPEDAVIDLLTDLRHLCDEYGLPWHDLNRTAVHHYREEIRPTEAAA